MQFSEKLLYLRTREGISQEEFASQLGVSRQAISKWEVGDSIPELGKIIEISKLFNITVDCLVKDELELTSDNSIEKMVIEFLNSARNMNQISDNLIAIAKDGVIDAEEKKQLIQIIETLDAMSAVIEELKMRVIE